MLAERHHWRDYAKWTSYFTQVGFVVLVGLASKNAILIVEFAKKEHESGAALRYATLAACKLRLRPIIMTSLAFILGALPLLISQGAGAEMRRTLGVAVFSGMLGVTIFGIFLTPVFYFTIGWLGETHLFAASRLRWVSDWILYFLALRFLRGPVKFVRKRLSSKRSAPAAPAAGHENGKVAAATGANGSSETSHAGDTALTNGFGTHTESVVEPK